MIYFLLIYSATTTLLLALFIKFAKVSLIEGKGLGFDFRVFNLAGIISPLSFKHDIKCGSHSGFRWCDILWYISGWRVLQFINLLVGRKDVVLKKYHEWMTGRFHYIACPVCVLFKRKARECKECDCGKPTKEVSSNENLKQT